DEQVHLASAAPQGPDHGAGAVARRMRTEHRVRIVVGAGDHLVHHESSLLEAVLGTFFPAGPASDAGPPDAAGGDVGVAARLSAARDGTGLVVLAAAGGVAAAPVGCTGSGSGGAGGTEIGLAGAGGTEIGVGGAGGTEIGFDGAGGAEIGWAGAGGAETGVAGTVSGGAAGAEAPGRPESGASEAGSSEAGSSRTRSVATTATTVGGSAGSRSRSSSRSRIDSTSRSASASGPGIRGGSVRCTVKMWATCTCGSRCTALFW